MSFLEAPATVIMKVASRCNLNCDYCYMYKSADKSYLKKPSVMSDNIFQSALNKLSIAARARDWQKLKITFHGGEPLLVGKKNLHDKLRRVQRTLSHIHSLSISLQTNGVLLDDEWINLSSVQLLR